MVPGSLVVIAEAVRSPARQPHGDPPGICGKTFFNHLSAAALIILPGQRKACPLSLQGQCPLAGGGILLKPVVILVSAQVPFYGLHAPGIILQCLPEIPSVIAVGSQRGKGGGVMAVLHFLPLEYLHGPAGVIARLLLLLQLHAGAGQICTGDGRLVGHAPPRYDRQGLQQLFLRGGKVPRLLVQQRDIVLQARHQHAVRLQLAVVDFLHLRIVFPRFLEPAAGAVGGGNVQQGRRIGDRALQPHFPRLLHGLGGCLVDPFPLAGLPVIAQQLIEQLQSGALVPEAHGFPGRLQHELLCLLAPVLLIKGIHLRQNPVHVQLSVLHAFPPFCP